jgi:hypothetical protein
MDYLFQDGGKPKAKKSKTGTRSKTGTKTTKSKTATKSKTSTKTGSKTTKSKTPKKGGNFLGSIGELVAPTGWGSFATAAALVGIDQADAALRRGKSTKSSAKKGGMEPFNSTPQKLIKTAPYTSLPSIHARTNNGPPGPPPVPVYSNNNGYYGYYPQLINSKIATRNYSDLTKNKNTGINIPVSTYKTIKKIYRDRHYYLEKGHVNANKHKLNSNNRKINWDKIIFPIYQEIIRRELPATEENIKLIIDEKLS